LVYQLVTATLRSHRPQPTDCCSPPRCLGSRDPARTNRSSHSQIPCHPGQPQGGMTLPRRRRPRLLPGHQRCPLSRIALPGSPVPTCSIPPSGSIGKSLRRADHRRLVPRVAKIIKA
jgi:hypothetical protein